MSKNLERWSDWSLGLDEMFNSLFRNYGGSEYQHESNSAPPHNVLDKGDGYELEVAVAGYEPRDINVSVSHYPGNHVVTVTGEKKSEKCTYLHKGITSKSFEKRFTYGDNLKLVSATVKNGLLSVIFTKQDQKQGPNVETIEVKSF